MGISKANTALVSAVERTCAAMQVPRPKQVLASWIDTAGNFPSAMLYLVDVSTAKSNEGTLFGTRLAPSETIAVAQRRLQPWGCEGYELAFLCMKVPEGGFQWVFVDKASHQPVLVEGEPIRSDVYFGSE